MSTRRDKPYGRRLKGLDAFIGEPVETAWSGQFVPIDKIQLSPQQPRRYFDLQKMEQLVQSVKEHGILEPLLVRPMPNGRYDLVAGERRYRAAQEAGLNEVPVMVRELSNESALQLALIENLQREDLNPIEETEGILQLLALELGVAVPEVVSLLYRMQNVVAGKITDNVISNSANEIVKEVFAGLGLMGWESFTANRLPLLRLPEEILATLRQGRIAYTKAKVIARIKNAEERQTLLEEAIAQNLSLKEIRERLKAEHPAPATESGSLKIKMQKIYHQFQTGRFWDSPEKKKRLEKLLVEIEAIIAEES